MTDKEGVDFLRFPIGKFIWVTELSEDDIQQHIQTLQEFPTRLKTVLKDASEDFLQKKYRLGGWTVAQIVNHLADSHMHSYLRFRHALLEDTPAIKNYEEKNWAELPDARSTDIGASLHILSGVHQRWTHLLSTLSLEDFKRGYFHPESNTMYPLETALAHYAWHGKHHLAHIRSVSE